MGSPGDTKPKLRNGVASPTGCGRVECDDPICGRGGDPPIAGYPWTVPHAVKTCGKCHVGYRRPEWVALEYVGTQLDFLGGLQLELRNCPCGNTLAVEVETPREAWPTESLGKLRPCTRCGGLRVGEKPGLCDSCAKEVRP